MFAGLVLAGPADDAAKNAESMIKDGKYQEALQVVTSALSVEPDHFKLNSLAGELYFRLADYKQAYQFYQKALDRKKKDPDALFGAGMSAFKNGDFQNALEIFQRGVDTGKLKGEFYYGLGITQTEMGNYSEGDLNVRKAINKDKKSAKYHLALAEVNYRNKVYRTAINEFDEALKLDSTFEKSIPDIHYKKARAYFNSRDLENAMSEYRKQLEKFPDDTTSWLELSRIYEVSDKPSEEVFCYQNYLKIAPNGGDIWFKLGRAFLRLRNNEEAAAAFEKAISFNSSAAESYGFLAAIYSDLKQYEKSWDSYARYEARFGAPDSALYWLEKGKVGIKLGTKNMAFFDSAVSSFKKSVRYDSTLSSGYEYAGLAFYYKSNYAGAIPYFIKKIELDSTSVNSMRNLAFCYLKTESYRDAAVILEKALLVKPDDIQMRSMLAKIYTFSKVYAQAIKHYEYILNSQAEVIADSLKCAVYPDLGISYLSMEKCNDATRYLLLAERCDPKDINVLMNIGLSYELCSRVKDANTYYKKVLAIDPGNKEAMQKEMQTHFQGQD